MSRTLQVLLIEDREEEGELTLRELARAGYVVAHRRVQSAPELHDALGREWDVILCDYSMPGFGARPALDIVRARGVDTPFLIVSGTIGEEIAVEMLKSGAHDFLVKGRLARLVPAIEREMREHATRRERLAAQRELRASEERFRRLAQSLGDFVFTLDRQMRFDGVYGRSQIHRTDVVPSMYLGRTTMEVLGDEAGPQHVVPMERAMAGENVQYEWSMRDTDGSTRYFHVSLAPQRDDAGESIVGVVGIGREITAEKRLQEQLLVSDRMASVGMLAAGVAHEINNPLAAVLGNLELATDDVRASLERGQPLDLAELASELGDALECAHRLRAIVKDLKIFSRSDEETSAPIDVAHVVESSLRMAWNEVRHRARTVRSYAEVPKVLGNESRLGQVVLNLIVNAAQAIPDGRAEENTIRVATGIAPDGRVMIEVQDSGCGMTPDVLRRLFTPFFTTKPVGVGTGLGLSICQRIVSGMGGEILVESAPGRGTTFRVMLPALADAASGLASGAAARSASLPVRGTALVIDDEPLMCDVLRRMLSVDFQVTTTTVARDALAMWKGGARFDVVLCDLMMPDVAGMDLYEELRELVPDQAERIVFMTGGVFSVRAREFLDDVPNPHIEKPFDPLALKSLVAEMVRASRAKSSSRRS